MRVMCIYDGEWVDTTTGPKYGEECHVVNTIDKYETKYYSFQEYRPFDYFRYDMFIPLTGDVPGEVEELEEYA